MVFYIHILFIALICTWVGYKINQPIGSALFSLALSLKVFAGLMLGYLYWFYPGSGDTISFYEQASELASISSNSWESYFHRLWINEFPAYKGESRTEFFTKILSVLLILTDQNYWLAAIYLSLFNFFCCVHLVNTICTTFPSWKWPAILGFLLIPSAVFWSSGVLKDPIANGVMVFLFAFMMKYQKQTALSLVDYLFAAIALVLLIKLRFYVAALIIVALVLILVQKLIGASLQNIKIQRLVIIGCALGMLLLVSGMDYNLNFDHLPTSIELNYKSISSASNAANTLHFDLQPDWMSIFKNIPKSLFYGLFAPLPMQGNLTNGVYWIENLLLLVLFLFNLKLIFTQKLKWANDPLLWCTLGFILVLASLLPLAAPNFGTLIRYKAAFLPLWWMLLSYPVFQIFLQKRSA